MVSYAARTAGCGIALGALILSLFATQKVCAQSSEPLKVVVPVTVDAQNGGITVGKTKYSPSATPGMQVIVLNRQPDITNPGSPVLIGNRTFTDAASANQFLESVLAATPDALILVCGVSGYNFAPADLAANLENFGADKVIEIYRQTWPFVLIGNGGLAPGSAHQLLVTDWVNPSPPIMSGSLAVDSNGNYTFIQTDYLTYDIGIDGTIKIGSTTYAAPNPCPGANSLNLVIVKSESPDKLLEYKIYCTTESDQYFTELTNLLSSYQDTNYLIFIASSGHPIPANWSFGADGDARALLLGPMITNFGGYWETIAYMTPNDTYALVGTGPPDSGLVDRRNTREASSVYLLNNPTAVQHATGELHGVLARGPLNNHYSPINADQTGIADMGLYRILGQTPMSFPHPANAEETAAFQFISASLCLTPTCNVRDQYPDLNVDVGTYLTLVEGMKDPSGTACDSTNAETPFCVVRQQLISELTCVAQIRNFSANVQLLWTSTQGSTINTLLKIYGSLESSFNPPSSATSGSLVSPIVNAFLGVLSYVPDIGPIFGIADTFFNLGQSLTTDAQGNPAATLTTTLTNLESQATNLFTAQGNNLGTQFQIIYQDWGKIKALGSALQSAQNGSPWYWTASTAPRLITAMAPAVEQAYYRSFLTGLYAIGAYYPTVWGSVSFNQTPTYLQPASYGAAPEGARDPQDTVHVFSTDYGYTPYTYPGDSIVQSLGSMGGPTSTLLAYNEWLGISLQSTPPYNGLEWKYQPPSTDTLTHLFSPISSGGLNVYRPAFFEGWPFPRVKCDASDLSGRGQYAGIGCPWWNAAPAIENLPAPLTKVSTRIHLPNYSPSPSGPSEVRLFVTNSGSGVARSINVDRILIKTLAGSGRATLVNPNMPLRTGKIAPGATVTFTVMVDIPSTVKKLAFTSLGEVDSGRAATERFTHQQALIISN